MIGYVLEKEVGREVSHLNNDWSTLGMGVGFNEALIDLDLLYDVLVVDDDGMFWLLLLYFCVLFVTDNEPIGDNRFGWDAFWGAVCMCAFNVELMLLRLDWMAVIVVDKTSRV